MWDIEGTDEFRQWYDSLTDEQRDRINDRIDLLAQDGPNLKRPTIGTIEVSRFYPRMKELRVSAAGAQLRVLCIFDPRRTAILLVGGNKTGRWSAWYDTAVPEADQLYEQYLANLRAEESL